MSSVDEEVKKFRRPRAWSDPEGCSSTVVLWDPNDWSSSGYGPKIYMCTNMGWIPLGLDTKDPRGSEKVAEEMAENYNLKEVSRERALWFAGHEGNEDDFE